MGIDLAIHEAPTEPEAAQAYARLRSTVEAELGEPPLPERRTELFWLRGVPRHRGALVLAHSGDQVLGGAHIQNEPAGANAHLGHSFVVVSPSARRAGIGRGLLDEVRRIGGEWGCDTLMFDEVQSTLASASGFAAAVGAVPGLLLHDNRVRVADIDRSMLERWVAEGPERAPGYHLLAMDGAMDLAFAARYARVLVAMNDAPTDDLDLNDEEPDAEMALAMTMFNVDAGCDVWNLFAVHSETDELAGFTTFRLDPGREAFAAQRGTAVARHHRGHGLGRWLKGVNLLRLLDERPSVEVVVTENAYTNGAMLAINDAIGFQPHDTKTIYQLKLR